MARPKIPLISRDVVLDLSLRIIDQEGLAALSVRRIGDELGVNCASLYHHFKNKHDILVSAAELALIRTPLRIPSRSVTDWRELLLLGAQQLRDFLLAHPALTPVIIQRRSEGMGNRLLENATKHLLEDGVSQEIIAPLFEAMERFIIGTAVRHIAERNASKNKISKAQFPFLATVMNRDSMDPEQIFRISILGIIKAIEKSSGPATNHAKEGRASRRRKLTRKAGQGS